MEEHVSATQNNSMGLIARIIGIFTSPGKTFLDIEARPAWLVPGIIILVLTLLFIFLADSVIIKESLEQQQIAMEKRGMTQEQIDEAAQRTAGFMKISIYGGAVVVTFISYFLWAAVLLFISNTILGGQAKYAQLLAVNVYRYFILMLGGFIKLPIILSKQTMNIHFSLATFMPDEQKTTFLYKLLAQIEFFNIWAVAVIAIGVGVMSRAGTKKSWPWVALVFVLWWVIQAGLGSMFG